MPKRYVVTGTPGAGKTSLLHGLQKRGWSVVEEAATDVIARAQAVGRDDPWSDGGFTSKIAVLQRRRELQLVATDVDVQFFDRSPLCTVALALFLQQPVPQALAQEIARIIRDEVYESTVFFVRPLGFVTPTAARRISYEDSLVFEAVHEAVYRDHGFELVDVASGSVEQRVAVVEARIAQEQRNGAKGPADA